MCEEEEYFEMNFCKMNAVPFGVATINRESLPWQLIVADSHRGRFSRVLNLSTNSSFQFVGIGLRRNRTKAVRD
jgi:hypothetical protein